MSCFRVILAIIFPPLAVVDKGCGSFLITFILTCIGWVPGVIAALVILNKDKDSNAGYEQGYNQGYNHGYNQGQRSNMLGGQQPPRQNRGNGWQGW